MMAGGSKAWRHPITRFLLVVIGLDLLLTVTHLPSTKASWAYLTPAFDVAVILCALIALHTIARKARRMTLASLTSVALFLAFVGFGNSIMQTYFPRPLELATDTFLIGSLVDLAEQSDRMGWFVVGTIGLALLTTLWGVLLWFVLKEASAVWETVPRNFRLGTLAVLACYFPLASSTGMTRDPGYPGRVSLYLTDQARHFFRESASFRPSDVARLRERREDLARSPTYLARLGKRPVYVFLIEAYGEVVFGDPKFRANVETEFALFDAALAEQGWHAASGYLVSPVYGGNSWIADSAFACGIPVRTELRFRQLQRLDLPCLAKLLSAAGYETFSVRPAHLRAWPQGDIFGFERPVLGSEVAYRGPRYYWSPFPDQYALTYFEHHVLKTPRLKPEAPFLAYFQLTSSHAPFNRIPVYVEDWEGLFETRGGLYHQTLIHSYPYSWWDLKGAEEGYTKAIAYDLQVIREYLSRFAPKEFLAIIVGDHQPASPITGERPFDVPLHVITDDPSLLSPWRAWDFAEGMRPVAGEAARPMDEFLDHFLEGYSGGAVSH